MLLLVFPLIAIKVMVVAKRVFSWGREKRERWCPLCKRHMDINERRKPNNTWQFPGCFALHCCSCTYGSSKPKTFIGYQEEEEDEFVPLPTSKPALSLKSIWVFTLGSTCTCVTLEGFLVQRLIEGQFDYDVNWLEAFNVNKKHF